MPTPLPTKPQGEAALLAYLGHEIDFAVNRRMRALAGRLGQDPLPGVREVLGSYACLQVQFDPLVTDHQIVAAWVEEAHQALPDTGAAPGRTVELPVVYGGEAGPDLPHVAERTGLSPEEVIRRHGAVDHPCYVVGFTPGFPYLGGLDPALTMPRMDEPRLDNPPGSVSVAGGQTGVYPLGGPGGWWVIGRTPWLLYDPRRDPATLVRAGDLIRFTPSHQSEFPAPPPLSLAWQGRGQEVCEVLHPGAFTTVQDAGRWGQQHRGVPVSGALDQAALARANLLVGNPMDAAALEITLLGPKLKLLRPTVMAVCGADLGLAVDGAPAPMDQAMALEAGQVVSFRGPKAGGGRAVLALAGGLASEELLGSRSTYILGRMGRPLVKGDLLRTAPGPLPQSQASCPPLEQPGGELTLRVVPGPNEEYFTRQGVEDFYGQKWKLSSKADRRGARLEGKALTFDPALPGSIVSEPNTPGVIQVPLGGQPIIMLREQTVGGYAKIATVFGPDLDRLARCQAGQALRFKTISPAEARAEPRRLGRELAALQKELAQ
ncbi:MAG: 5-oxoprolinase subunit PxpB [Desulfarculaceae bacterium]|nr:5-oxoprolinase subunit PxpB [Desulfarculaceae bacterium]